MTSSNGDEGGNEGEDRERLVAAVLEAWEAAGIVPSDFDVAVRLADLAAFAVVRWVLVEAGKA